MFDLHLKPRPDGNQTCRKRSFPCVVQAFKEETYQQQIEMEKLSHQGEVLHRKAEGTANRDMLEAPLRELRRQWAVLDSKIITRQVEEHP